MAEERKVICSKYKQELPGLSAAPFSGELGEQIYASVSAKAWKEWADDVMIKVINEYRLDLSDEAQYERLLQQMRAFLGLDQSADVLEVGNAERGRE